MAQWELNFTLINPKTKLLETQKTPGITTPINYSRAQMARTSNCTVIKPKWMIFKQIFDLLQNFTSCWNSNDNLQVQRAEMPVPCRVLFAGLCQESWMLNPCPAGLRALKPNDKTGHWNREWTKLLLHPQVGNDTLGPLRVMAHKSHFCKAAACGSWHHKNCWCKLGGLSVCLSGSSEMHKLKTGEQTDPAL